MIINIDNYYKWYFLPKVKFNIIKYTKYRECSFINHKKSITIRMMKIHSVQHIDFFLKNINWSKNKWNLYYSLAKYNGGIPNQKFDYHKRDNSEWRKNHHKSMKSYDLLIDIDASDHSEIQQAKKSAIKVCKRLMDSYTKFDIRFSGCGFHIVIKYDDFPKYPNNQYSFDPNSDNSIYSMYSLVCKKFASQFSEMIDYNLNDARRLCKIPYSLSIYENNIYVCMPMTYDQLIHFELEDYTPENIIRLKWLDVKH